LKRASIQLAVLAGAALLIWLLFERTGFDRRITALAYDPALSRFPLQHSWPLEKLGHDALKWLMLGFWLACLAWRPLRRGALYMALAAVSVSLLKHSSPRSCPWDLPEYGAALSGPGGCSPAGHPVVGFALFGLYFALRDERPGAARAALAAAWVIGLVAGAVQIARGAHFTSHVLWTAWVSWTVTLAAAALAPAAWAPRRA
jgi:membrane-associated PAP2 superfamily phosphatase